MSLRSDIQSAVDADRFVVSQHAATRLRERGIALWQITAGLSGGKLLLATPDALPHPKIELEQSLADGTAVKVVWSFDIAQDEARLVTVHYFDR